MYENEHVRHFGEGVTAETTSTFLDQVSKRGSHQCSSCCEVGMKSQNKKGQERSGLLQRIVSMLVRTVWHSDAPYTLTQDTRTSREVESDKPKRGNVEVNGGGEGGASFGS